MNGDPSSKPMDPAMEADATPASPEEVASQIAAMAPQPERAFTVSTIQSTLKSLNEFISAASGGQTPSIEWTPEGRGEKWPSPLPAQVFVPVYALDNGVKAIAGDLASKYDTDPQKLVDDSALRKLAATLGKMTKDKKLLAELSSAGGEAGMADTSGSAPLPSEMDEDDDMIQESM